MISRKNKDFLIFLFPSLLVLLAVIVGPLLYSFVVSFFSTSLKVPGIGQFMGLGNYTKALNDRYFVQSGTTTLLFMVLVVLFEFVVGFGIALLLNRDLKGKNIFFSIIIIPMMITPIAVGLLWRLLLHPNLGIVNFLLESIGIQGQAWLGDARFALGTVIFIDIWQQVPYMVLVLMAGLVSLPAEPYEAVAIDGASPVQTFCFITVPMLAPTFTVALLLRSINALKTYDLIYVLTKGGPGTTTEMLSYHIYKQAFTYLKIGEASAMSYILVALIVPISYLFIKASKNKTI